MVANVRKEFQNVGSCLWGLPPQLAKRHVQVLAKQQLFLGLITVTCVRGFFLPTNFYISCRRHTHTHSHSKYLRKAEVEEEVCQTWVCVAGNVCMYCTRLMGGRGGSKCQANMIQAASGGNERLQRLLSPVCTGNLSQNEAEPNKPRRQARSHCHLSIVVQSPSQGSGAWIAVVYLDNSGERLQRGPWRQPCQRGGEGQLTWRLCVKQTEKGPPWCSGIC